MDQKAVYKLCKEIGCCDGCCVRYLGIKNYKAYENLQEFVAKFREQPDQSQASAENGKHESQNNEDSHCQPPSKRQKTDGICVSCLGILQTDSWPESVRMVKEMLDKKNYDCPTFACALSAPMVTILRERLITLRLEASVPGYEENVTPLKEAWKFSFGAHLSNNLDKTLDSGAVSPLLVTLNMEYQDDLQELEILKTISSDLFKSRSQQKRRFTVDFTRRSVEQALEDVTLEALSGVAMDVENRVKCVSVVCTRMPVYLGGRYVKLSRELPQTPWLIKGKRIMESSVQETIFQPIARFYGLSPEETEHRLKFMSAGREDVDVRCLGEGRPFAIEITDPRRELTSEELEKCCEEISESGKVVVKKMVPIVREDLPLLKQAEENKCKTYEALCIKLGHSKNELLTNGNVPSQVTVTDEDITAINTYTNTPDSGTRVLLTQKTPIRVLHRRTLLTRTRRLLDMEAEKVEGHPQLFKLRLTTEAGTYIKETVHGELRRTRPSVCDITNAPVDILALDIVAMHQLTWKT